MMTLTGKRATIKRKRYLGARKRDGFHVVASPLCAHVKTLDFVEVPNYLL